MTLPPSRVLQSSDCASLWPQLDTVDRHWTRESAQHPARKVEYASVLAVLDALHLDESVRRLVDVGGAGSPMPWMVEERLGVFPFVVDPSMTTCPTAYGGSLSDYLQTLPRLADVVVSVSVIEHVADEFAFVRDLVTLVRPGGLLILTMDYSPIEGPDTHHFHWMRQRIYTPTATRRLEDLLRKRDCWLWLQNTFFNIEGPDMLLPEYNYTFFQLVARKTL